MRYILFFILPILAFVSCTKKSGGDGSPPEISFLSVEGAPFKFSDTASKVSINFYLKAKDKKFGNPDHDSAISLREFRSDTLYRAYYFPLPEIPDEVMDPDYFEAFIKLPLKGIFFTPRFDSVHIRTLKDTLYFEINVKDEAGKESNVLKSELIHIQQN